MNLQTNVLIAGKTGVGKSEFINYIYGENKRASMAGRPVTGVGLYKEVLAMDNLTVNLYDSWGLEANKSEEWSSEVLNQVSKHDKSSNIRDWFHTIFYCFSAQSARIEDFEKDKILTPLIKSGNKVIVIFTHCDVKDAQTKVEGMKESLNNIGIDNKNIICVASKKKKLLNGSYKEPFGKEAVIKAIRNNLWDYIKPKIKNQYISVIQKTFDIWKKECTKEIEENIKITNIHNIEKKLLNTFSSLLDDASSTISYQCGLITRDCCDYYNKLQSQLALTLYKETNNTHNDDISMSLNDISMMANEMLDDQLLSNSFSSVLKCSALVSLGASSLALFTPILGPIGIAAGIVMSNKKKTQIKENLTYQVSKIHTLLSAEVDNIASEFYKSLP